MQGLGGYGEFVERAGDLGAALQRALTAGRPGLLNVAVQRAISPRAEAAIGRRKLAAQGGYRQAASDGIRFLPKRRSGGAASQGLVFSE